MDLVDALRTTGSVREFEPEPVSDAVIRRILDTARFAPNGGNRQAWRVIVVNDAAIRARLRDLYLIGWYEYLAQLEAGLTPFAPLTDRAAEARANEQAPAIAQRSAGGASAGFAEHLDRSPVLLVVLADLRQLAAVDRDLDRYTLVGGASVFPFAWSVLLAARAEGLGGVITTMVTRQEPAAKQLLGVPEELCVAAMLALGRPVHQPTRLTRKPVDSFTTVDHFEGAPLSGRQPA
jgi:nitroreductase